MLCKHNSRCVIVLIITHESVLIIHIPIINKLLYQTRNFQNYDFMHIHTVILLKYNYNEIAMSWMKFLKCFTQEKNKNIQHKTNTNKKRNVDNNMYNLIHRL